MVEVRDGRARDLITRIQPVAASDGSRVEGSGILGGVRPVTHYRTGIARLTLRPTKVSLTGFGAQNFEPTRRTARLDRGVIGRRCWHGYRKYRKESSRVARSGRRMAP
jgi:hypothetical protein